MARLNTHLEASGAEFLVLGNLLIEGIPTYKAYQNFPGYDLISTNPDKNKSLRIQVKSRYSTSWDGFIINNYDCDFVVLATLNRGFNKVKKNGDIGVKMPEFYILPIAYVKSVVDDKSTWGKIKKGKMVGYEKYLNNWNLIKKALGYIIK